MKTLFLSLGFLIICVVVAQDQAHINFETKKHDFGRIDLQKDSIFTTTFFFENQGTIPLLIQKITTSCGCTDPEWTKQPVEPGKKGFVKITFDPKGFSGKVSKNIFVRSNAKIEKDVYMLNDILLRKLF